jgi:hypothetical protein
MASLVGMFVRGMVGGAAAMAAVVLMSMMAVVGCSPAANRPALAVTSGVVTFNGSPLADAQIVFLPADASGGALASGKTDAKGTFVLSTFGTGDGAIPGDKLVKVVAQSQGKSEKEGNEPGSPDYEAPKDLIPKKYFSEATSGLKATVVAGKRNTFEFALTDDAK